MIKESMLENLNHLGPGLKTMLSGERSRVIEGIERSHLQEALAYLDAQGDRSDPLFPNESFELLRTVVDNDVYWGDSRKDVANDMRALLKKLERTVSSERDPALADVVFGPKKAQEMGLGLNRAERRSKLSREKRERKARARAKERRK